MAVNGGGHVLAAAASRPDSAEMSSPAAGRVDDTDELRAREAAQALVGYSEVVGWADRFALLGDVNRLRIVLALHRAPGMTVGGLADAVGMTQNAVSHSLAALRVTGVLSVDRDGRFRRWSVRDEAIHDILHHVGATHSALHPEH